MSFPDHRVRRSEYISDQSREENSNNQGNVLVITREKYNIFTVRKKEIFLFNICGKKLYYIKGLVSRDIYFLRTLKE